MQAAETRASIFLIRPVGLGRQEINFASVSSDDFSLLNVQDAKLRSLDLPRLTEKQLKAELAGKVLLRKVLAEGPIALPTFTRAFLADENFLKDLNSNNIEFENRSAIITGDNLCISHEDFIANIGACKLALPIIFKPNRGALGRGVMIVGQERNSENLLFVLANLSDDFNFSQTKAIQNLLLSDYPDLESRNNHKKNLYSFKVPQKDPCLSDLLQKLFLCLTFSQKEESKFIYDAGFFEEYVPLLKVNGNAYETRYRIDVRDGALSMNHERHSSYHREGSSPYFANVAGRHWQPVYKEKHDALIDAYGFQGQEYEFDRQVEALVMKEAEYLIARLRSAGITIQGNFRIEFDLAWFPKNVSPDKPKPFLVEANVFDLD